MNPDNVYMEIISRKDFSLRRILRDYTPDTQLRVKI